jgi:transposase
MDNSLTPRFVGIDLHKHFAVVAAVNAQQRLVLPPTRPIDLDDFPAWASTHLYPTDVVVLEATGNAWWLYDLLAPLVQRVVVANSLQVKWIAHAAVKTDKHDAVRLAKLLAANLIPEVWVPPLHVRELRALLAHRRALVKQRTAVKNRLHSVLHRQQIKLPSGDPFAAHNRAWWLALGLSPTERLRLRQDLDTLEHVEKQLADLDGELARLSNQPPWNHAMPFLIQLPGLALLSAMTALAAIGDITRFPTAKHLVGYAGLGTRIHDSGETSYDGHISKAGRRDLRRVLIEAAWSAVNTHPYWKAEFARLCRHKPQGVAIVAIARKLLVAIWHVLTERAADHHANPVMVACKLMRWSWQLTEEQRGGLTSRQFVRYGLLRLRLGNDLTTFTYGGMPRGLASVEEILARFPDLAESP